MKKTLYSLMLNDEVVHEIDLLAHRQGTNRSSLINQILAEYVNFTTPEKRINAIFSSVEQFMQPYEDIIPFFTPNTFTMSLKSCLDFKYRPTIKYDVELFKWYEDSIGQISLLYRTQSAALLSLMRDFFDLWIDIESQLLPVSSVSAVRYTAFDGKVSRSISVPKQDLSPSDLAQAISDYIKLFDSLFKDYLSGKISASDVRSAYSLYVKSSDFLI